MPLHAPLICAVLIASALPNSSTLASESEVAPQSSPDAYRLVWSDEFDVEGPPNPANWGFERGYVRNQELQWYQRENAVCQNGLLVIEARKQPQQSMAAEQRKRLGRFKRLPANDRAHYTSASLHTRGKHQWKYGRFEMRAKLNVQPGMWPAFWTLGVEGYWPANGEIDVMEYYDGVLLANAAWLGERRAPVWDAVRTPLARLGGADWAGRFHVWRMDWTPQTIRLFVDDRLLNEVDLTNTINANGPSKNPFHQPHYLLVNLAVGGTRGGDPAGAEFPARYLVDYVRVYQRKAD